MNAPATKTNIAALRGNSKKSLADILSMPKTQQLPAMLESFKGEIKRALPTHLNADRISRIALTAFRSNKQLMQCEPQSIFAAIIQSSQLGLEIGTLGRAYLVPYGKECQFIPGWKGLVELVHRAGQASVWTGAVFEGDFFQYALGDSPHVRHQPGGESDPKRLTHVYAIGRPKGSDWPIIEVWSIARVIAHRDRYNKVGNKHYSFGNVEMYARKVVLLQVLKYLPMSPELERAVTMNDDAEIGKQKLDIEDAIDGEYTAVNTDGNPPQTGEDDNSAGTTVEPANDPPTNTGSATAEPANGQAKSTRTRAPALEIE